jgi:hypothetical protein
MGRGMVQLKRVELIEQRQKAVVNCLQLPWLIVRMRVVGHHDSAPSMNIEEDPAL